MIELRIDRKAQFAFADLSGDVNPMHVDDVYARRTMYGEIVVHGVHVILRAIDALIPEGVTTARVKARFQKPVYVNEQLFLEEKKADRANETYDIRSDTESKILLTVSFAGGQSRVPIAPGPAGALRKTPKVVDNFSSGAEGSIEIFLKTATASVLFPRLAASDPAAIAVFCAATRLVGMEMPGEHSIFSELDLSWSGVGDALKWRLSSYDPRFNLAKISISGRASGIVQAFNRPRPFKQPTTTEISALVRDCERLTGKALVIGGSRGLGEVAAKILAARGADVIVTYRSGREDAERVVEEIQTAGFSAAAFKLDSALPEDAKALNSTHPDASTLLYFASPAIFRGSRLYSAPLFDEFAAAYVSDFARLIQPYLDQNRPMTVLYPSTVALSEFTPKMLEYAAAKAAGEQLCADLARTYPKARFIVERFPRLSTDQTQSLTSAPFDRSAADYLASLLANLK